MSEQERRAGNSRLVYNKATRTIDTVRTANSAADGYLLAYLHFARAISRENEDAHDIVAER